MPGVKLCEERILGMVSTNSPEWYKWASELERSLDCTVEAGLIPYQFEKLYDQTIKPKKGHLAPLTFYYFVHYSRRKHGLSVKDLSQKAGIDFEELMALECDTQYKLEPDSVIKLAKYFGVDKDGLVKMAKLDAPRRDPTWEKPAVQFPDMVDSTEELNEIAQLALMLIEGFLAKQAKNVKLEYAA